MPSSSFIASFSRYWQATVVVAMLIGMPALVFGPKLFHRAETPGNATKPVQSVSNVGGKAMHLSGRLEHGGRAYVYQAVARPLAPDRMALLEIVFVEVPTGDESLLESWSTGEDEVAVNGRRLPAAGASACLVRLTPTPVIASQMALPAAGADFPPAEWKARLQLLIQQLVASQPKAAAGNG